MFCKPTYKRRRTNSVWNSEGPKAWHHLRRAWKMPIAHFALTCFNTHHSHHRCILQPQVLRHSLPFLLPWRATALWVHPRDLWRQMHCRMGHRLPLRVALERSFRGHPGGKSTKVWWKRSEATRPMGMDPNCTLYIIVPYVWPYFGGTSTYIALTLT